MGAIGDSIHEIGCFCGYEEQNDAAVHIIGPFYGYEVTGIEIIAKKKLGGLAELISLLATSETNLFVERSSNVNRTSNCTTNHWVVTDAEESHHLNVCWN